MTSLSLYNILRDWINNESGLYWHFDTYSFKENYFIACDCDSERKPTLIIYVYDKYVVIHDPGYSVSTLRAHEPDFFDILKGYMLQRDHTPR